MKFPTAAAAGLAIMFSFAAIAPALAQDNPNTGAGAAPAIPGDPAATPSPGAAIDGAAPLFVAGESLIGLNIGSDFPLFILSNSASTSSQLYPGGLFGFSYQQFIAQGLAIGGSLDGVFNGTIGGSSLFIAPLGFRTAYWWGTLPFEFYVAGELGAYIMRLGNNGALGGYAKVGGGAFWRASPGWSVGLQTFFWYVPEIHATASNNSQTGFAEVQVAAYYHL